MKGSRRTRLAALGGFFLITVLLLGGMTWATVTTFELEKKDIRDAHTRSVLRAVSEIDTHVRGILAREAARPYTDYMDYHTTEAEAVLAEDGTEVEDADLVVVKSPLKEFGPPYEWIDLYFQVYEDGTWTWPQVPSDIPVWVIDTFPKGSSVYRAYSTFEWLKSELPVAQLWERVDRARERDRALATGTSGFRQTQAIRFGPRASQGALKYTTAWSDYQQRSQSKDAAQRSSLPAAQCVHERLVERHLVEHGIEGRSAGDHSVFACSPPVTVGISPEPMATFWLGPKEGEGLKLAFVRTGNEDDKAVQQGFIGDWDRLNAELLEVIAPWFPQADIEPVSDDVGVDPTTSEAAIASIHARLKVPGIPGGVAAAAWRHIRGWLYTTWAVALVVLALAGWGLRNLVALTERRMQFAYAVTHELRTPLTTFRLYSDMLSAGLVPDESKPEYLDTLNRESARLSSLVEGVLEYARLENHQVRLNSVETDALSLLGLISDSLRERCAEHGVEAQTKNAVSDGQKLHTDVDLVNQIAGVLVNNACRHARGADNPTVLVQLSSDNGVLHLDVIDSGPGIDRADARAVFKPFRRGRKASAAAQGGIGLGLALARSWAGLLGGRLDLIARHDSRYGGARFRLTIPMRVQE